MLDPEFAKQSPEFAEYWKKNQEEFERLYKSYDPYADETPEEAKIRGEKEKENRNYILLKKNLMVSRLKEAKPLKSLLSFYKISYLDFFKIANEFLFSEDLFSEKFSLRLSILKFQLNYCQELERNFFKKMKNKEDQLIVFRNIENIFIEEFFLKINENIQEILKEKIKKDLSNTIKQILIPFIAKNRNSKGLVFLEKDEIKAEIAESFYLALLEEVDGEILKLIAKNFDFFGFLASKSSSFRNLFFSKKCNTIYLKSIADIYIRGLAIASRLKEVDHKFKKEIESDLEDTIKELDLQQELEKKANIKKKEDIAKESLLDFIRSNPLLFLTKLTKIGLFDTLKSLISLPYSSKKLWNYYLRNSVKKLKNFSKREKERTLTKNIEEKKNFPDIFDLSDEEKRDFITLSSEATLIKGKFKRASNLLNEEFNPQFSGNTFVSKDSYDPSSKFNRKFKIPNTKKVEKVDDFYRTDNFDSFDKRDKFDNEAYKSRKSALATYGTDITQLAREGKLEESFGRNKELLEMMEILVRRQKNNPVLVGDAGVGKTAIIELFAIKIVNNIVPFVLQGRSIISIDLARIIGGARYRGEFELRLQKILKEVLRQPDKIIFIDEIHTLSGTGAAEGSLDAANILKPILSRSGFQCIGATTGTEYQRIEKDPALNRRFQPIKVNEPSVEDTIGILYGLRPTLESYHNVSFAPGALKAAAELASRYIYDRFLPDKAIDLVDRVAAKNVIAATTIKSGTIISGIASGLLQKIGTLKAEAFRRGDIASQFIFQEIENAYRNFLFQWIENPLSIDETKDSKMFLNRPISDALFDKMRIAILKHVDSLLFASNKPRYVTKPVKKFRSLSVFKNLTILNTIRGENKPKLSNYRIAVLLFFEWLSLKNKLFPYEIIDLSFFYTFKTSFENKGLRRYICKQIQKKEEEQEKKGFSYVSFRKSENFLEEDIEKSEETFEVLTELEDKQINTYVQFFKDLKPLLRRGIIGGLYKSSELNLSANEQSLIYALLGYFSTDTGREFLVNLALNEEMRNARKEGDLTTLKNEIKVDDVKSLVSDMTGIPMKSLSSTESKKLLDLENEIHKRVIGQDEAVSAIAKAVRRSRLGLQNPNRPMGSFLFCGPTGVGKTEVTKALASIMFGSESDMIRFDMSEFMEKFTISRLIGSPPGYVGYEDGGQLTDAVRKKPYSVVLFDEVEKAHPDVLNILLQILEDGRLTDSQKRLIPFENTIIVMTSNAGAEEIQRLIKIQEASSTVQENNQKTSSESKNKGSYEDDYSGSVNFLNSPIKENFLDDIRGELKELFTKSYKNVKKYGDPQKQADSELEETKGSLENSDDIDKNQKLLKETVLNRLTTVFLPEFLNRLDDIIIFKPLKVDELRKICDVMIAQVQKRLEKNFIHLKVEDAVKTKLTKDGYNPTFGARPLRRLITKYVEDLVSEVILKTPIAEKNQKTKAVNRKIVISLDENNKIVVNEST
jgi:ATP-dependent Clp protease ATP-binding subunit ClpA